MSESLWERVLHAVRGFMYGAAKSWVIVPYQLKKRQELEHMFVLLMLSEYEGASLAPPDLQLRLLPYLIPQILYWRRRMRLWDDDLEMAHLPHLGH